MSLLTNRKVILAKIESDYAVDPTPSSSDSMLVKNLDVQPLNAELVSRDLIRPFLGNSDTLIASRYCTAAFEVEMAGAGAVGVAAPYAALLKACAFAETLNTSTVTIARSSAVATVAETAHGRSVGDVVQIAGANETDYNGNQTITGTTTDAWTFHVLNTPATPATGTITAGISAVYSPVSTNFDSITIYYNVDGVLHILTGCRGTFELDVEVKTIPTFKFTFTGLYNAPSDSAAPGTNFAAFQIPKVATTSNTPSFSLFGYSGFLKSVALNMANAVAYRTLIGTEEVKLTDRKPAGTFVIEAPTISAKDFWTLANNGTTGALAITHGLVGGNKVALAAPRVSIGNPTYSDDSGVQMLSLPFVAAPNTGNDEVSITLK